MTTSTLVDTNILIEIVARDGDAERRRWAQHAFLHAAGRGSMLINLVVWSELAQPFENEAAMQAVFGPLALQREELPWQAAFVAGQAHGRYRRKGGSRPRTLPDFLIGAHALVRGHSLLTRDASRYRSYFPDLDILSPETHP